MQGGVINLHAFLLRDGREVADDERGGDAAEVEALAAGEDGGQHLLRVRGGEHELHVRRRLLEGLEQRVERRRGEHVDFVDDVDFELRGGGRELARLAQLAHLLDAVVARAVDLQHVERAALGDFHAARIVHIKVGERTAGAVERLGEDARERGLARAARTAEQVGVRDAAGCDGIGQRARDMLLTDNVREALRAVFAGDDLIRHEKLGIKSVG